MVAGAVAQFCLAECEGFGPVTFGAIGLNRKALAEVVLSDHQKSHDGNIVGPEVGFAKAANRSILIVFG